MDALVASLLNSLLAGGNSAIIVILIFVCYALWSERGRLLEQNEVSLKRLDGSRPRRPTAPARLSRPLRECA
jgi:hypothetical protein